VQGAGFEPGFKPSITEGTARRKDAIEYCQDKKKGQSG
jgi:hypothetical protein